MQKKNINRTYKIDTMQVYFGIYYLSVTFDNKGIIVDTLSF